MINAFTIGETWRILIHYHEQVVKTVKDGKWVPVLQSEENKLVKMENKIEGVEIIEVTHGENTGRIFRPPIESFSQIAEAIKALQSELIAPIHENELYD